MNTVLMADSNSSKNLTETCQAVVFKIADRYLALPQTAIVRVVSTDLPSLQTTSKNQITLLDGALLTILPLDRLLDASPAQTHPFLVIARHPGNLLAIPVSDPPILLDIPLTKISILPPLHRQQIHNVANYIAFLDYQAQSISILLLDLKQALRSALSR